MFIYLFFFHSCFRKGLVGYDNDNNNNDRVSGGLNVECRNNFSSSMYVSSVRLFYLVRRMCLWFGLDAG